MLAALIFCSLLTTAFCSKAAVLKFSIRPDTVNVGTELPFEIDVLDSESKVFRRSALGLASKWKGQIRGFAIMKNISNSLALIKFGHPDLNQVIGRSCLDGANFLSCELPPSLPSH
ncbi:hypothetical protein TELCIR_00337 [Teladorsagia circumcincta]|uniref:Uncharacterized protein n=1 Tax=Teladorsagia circumcincta TaxID=45464 RepID=A0A2G9V512_TELCI|nr:hypothetical protein TELCIR_00337 [Teladorsagia circumcincta]